MKTVKSSDIHGKQYVVPVDRLVWRPAAYAIVIHDGKILLTKQHKALHLPGGGIELGEMPEDGVVREVKEETGLDVSKPQLVGSISGFFTVTSELTPDTQHVHSILLYYQCDLVGGELSIDGFEDDEKIVGDMPEWVPTKQLDYIVAGSTVDWRGIVKRLLKRKAG
ncbi:MAG TPA: NUDIX domain-containing protein [Candidatus Saccharimonadales bacterium]|nr:NUDIX domain-containing protein [Candidatus Saccharimonadales bacterium]